jgi:hypothetical protein
MKQFQKAKFFLDSCELTKTYVSYTHTGPKIVITTFEAFRSEI